MMKIRFGLDTFGDMNVDDQGKPYAEATIKAMHTTMQTLGRIAIISGTVAVALVNIWMFSKRTPRQRVARGRARMV